LCAAGRFVVELYNGWKPDGAPIGLCISAFFAGGDVTGDPFSVLISFWCTCRNAIRLQRS
jgi:hypothetical protein